MQAILAKYIQIVSASCTFYFQPLRVLERFALSAQCIVSRIRIIKIETKLYDSEMYRDDVSRAFSAAAISDLKNLQGVHIDCEFSHGLTEVVHLNNIMSNPC